MEEKKVQPCIPSVSGKTRTVEEAEIKNEARTEDFRVGAEASTVPSPTNKMRRYAGVLRERIQAL